jgi:abhydrolase domain-containing protein 8
VPEANRQRASNSGEGADEVTLRNRNRKPMIVFLHGFGSSAEAFEHQLRYFANLGYPCIAPDLLGHGLSSAPNRPRDYHFEKLFKDLETVLLHYAFKPGQKCVLVAHNYG